MTTPQSPLHTPFTQNSTAADVLRGLKLSGKTALVTGGHSGIGLETTRALTQAGAIVIVAARNPQKAVAALASLRNVFVLPLDLADPNSIDIFATQFLHASPTLDLLINNAGIMALPELTHDPRGYELQFATNHLGHFQLTARLWPALVGAQGARVINLSSFGHRFAGVDLHDLHFRHRPYNKWHAYGQSKTANILFTVELDRRGRDLGIRSFAVHPGRILHTSLARHLSPDDLKAAGIYKEDGNWKGPGILNLRTPQQGAATTLWCATSPQLNDQGGVYCVNSNIAELVSEDSPFETTVRQYAVDPTLAHSLWTTSEHLTNLCWPQPHEISKESPVLV